jgi:hypothetical protein
MEIAPSASHMNYRALYDSASRERAARQPEDSKGSCQQIVNFVSERGRDFLAVFRTG